MKRTELYKLVWSKPMTKLGAELGISDVGLAKACRRHAIPVPPRGAGKTSVQVPLPQPGTDMEVSFTTVPPARRQAEVAQKREAKAVVAKKAEALRAVAPTRKLADARPHSLVRKTGVRGEAPGAGQAVGAHDSAPACVCNRRAASPYGERALDAQRPGWPYPDGVG